MVSVIINASKSHILRSLAAGDCFAVKTFYCVEGHLQCR